jgi:hypothetical protein
MKVLKLALAGALAFAAAPTMPQAPSATPSWLVAQISYCDLDGRKVPTETTTCRESQTWVCSKSGTWTNTNKPC